jgi:hypothetical protein
VTNRPAGLRWAGLAGLPVLVVAEIFLRRNLEHADKYLYSFLDYFYKSELPAIFARPWWRLLLPIRELTGAWSVSIVITHLVELRVGVPNTWYLFNALLVVVSFTSAWLVFESLAFAYTFAICMGFGTHFFHTYAVTGGMASPLIACAFEVALMCACRFVVAERRARWWGAAFGASLLWAAVSYEGWLDLAAFGCVATALFAVLAWHQGAAERARRLFGVCVAVTVTAMIYVFIKTRIGYGQNLGSESDVIFNYRQWSPFLEDLASNVVTHLYMSVTNFLPPMLTSSTALYEIGPENLVALQYGYHQPYSYLVAMHYLFLWRYAAGALALGLAWLCVKLIARAWKQPSRDAIVGIAGLLMMWLAGSTHALVKIRPMKVAPIMTYHVLVGVIGAAVLISYGALMIWRDWRSVKIRVAATACLWGVLFYGALARPLMLSHLAAQTGLGAGLYPDPMASLLQMAGQARGIPGGGRPYQLVRRLPGMSDEAVLPPLVSDRPALPIAAPDLSTWARGRNVGVTRVEDGWVVTGNEEGGYQVTSPVIPVPPHRRLVVHAQGTVYRGKVCLGVLDKNLLWLLAPTPGVSELSADTGNNGAVTLVISTCAPEGNFVPAKFIVRSVSYAILMNSEEERR